MKPTQFKIPNPPPSQILNISQFGGINLSTIAAEIADNEAADMRNFLLDVRGALDKRKGYKRLFEPIGEGLINGMTIYRKSDGTEEFIFAHTTKLYKLDTVTNTYTMLYDGLADTIINFFTISDKLYMLDGVKYRVYDGLTVSDVVGYIPTVFTECVPSGSGNEFEQLNLITRAYKQNFSSDGTATEYQLAYYPLGTEPITGEYFDETGKHDLVEETNFTVDREKGKITLTTAIAKGVGNVTFKAYRETDNSNEILKCRVSELYGGNNDTRVFLIGSYPNRVYYSGLTTTGLDPTYFPANNLINIGATNEVITGMVKQYDTLVILKEHSMYYMRYATDDKGLGIFPVMPLNSQVGCISPYSIQLIENAPVFLSKDGVYILNQSNVRDERNVSLISEKVNKMLLTEDLKLATSIDFDSKYFLCFPTGRVYVYDYRRGVWYIWDNIYANCFLEYNRELYFGGNGIVYRFRRDDDKFKYVDDLTTTIRAYWKSKAFNFASYERNKIIKKMFLDIRPQRRTSASVYSITEDATTIKDRNNLFEYNNFDYRKSLYMTDIFNERAEHLGTYFGDIISYKTFSYNRTTYSANIFVRDFMNKVKIKKQLFVQFVIENNKNNEGLIIENMSLLYAYQNFRK